MPDDEYKRRKYTEKLYELDPIDKDPFFETFDVFQGLDLKGKTLIKALEIVLQKADDLYKNWEIQINVNKISAYRYHEGSFESAILTEDKIMSEINKSLNMLEYEHALLNFRSLANFYKKAFYKTKVYEPFFKYLNKVLRKFQEIQEIINKFEEKKFEIDQLQVELQFYQKENSELKNDKEDIRRKFKLFENHYKNMFLNEKVLRFFIGAVDRKILKSQEGYTIFQIMSRILWDGRMAKKDLAKSLGLSQKELTQLIEPYKEMFVFINEYIDLNFEFEPIKRHKLLIDYDDSLKKYGLIEDSELSEEEKIKQFVKQKSKQETEVSQMVEKKKDIIDEDSNEEIHQDRSAIEDKDKGKTAEEEIIEEEISDEELIDEDNPDLDSYDEDMDEEKKDTDDLNEDET